VDCAIAGQPAIRRRQQASIQRVAAAQRTQPGEKKGRMGFPFQEEFKLVTISLRLINVFFTNVAPVEGRKGLFLAVNFLRDLTRRRRPSN
jgi:hypothetical protein